MPALDHKKQLADLYNPSAKAISIVDVPPLRFLMVDGEGNPNTSLAYKEALEALYGLSYTLKFMIKRQHPDRDYSVLPLEGLWWTDTAGRPDFTRKDTWKWTAMIMQPEAVTDDLVEQAARELDAKKHPPGLARVRFDVFHEGPAAQVLYVGPYADERPTIERLHAFIRGQGHELRGKHHEIYLSDPSRTAPARLKTIIRQPFA
jgi:hypothetical protein